MNARLKHAVKEVTKSFRYHLIKLDDATEYLDPAEFKTMIEVLEPFLEKIM